MSIPNQSTPPIDIEEKKIKVEWSKFALEAIKLFFLGIGGIVVFLFLTRPESLSSKGNVSFNWVIEALKLEKEYEQVLALQLARERIKEVYGDKDNSVVLIDSYIENYLDKASVVDSMTRINTKLKEIINRQKEILKIYEKYPISGLDKPKTKGIQLLIDSTQFYIDNPPKNE